MTSSSWPRGALPPHVAIIMDGNGRWGLERGLPRLAGHREGVGALRRVVAHAAALGLPALTVFAFSEANWQRPPIEVRGLFEIFRRFFSDERQAYRRRGIKLTVIGRRDRLPRGLGEAIAATEAVTAGGTGLRFRLAIDYSSRRAIQAAWSANGGPGPPGFAPREGTGVPDVDLLIRSGGEHRLSDFLLWESANAELYFTEVLWPDFQPMDLERAIDAYRRRDRRFGRLSPRVEGPPSLPPAV